MRERVRGVEVEDEFFFVLGMKRYRGYGVTSHVCERGSVNDYRRVCLPISAPTTIIFWFKAPKRGLENGVVWL